MAGLACGPIVAISTRNLQRVQTLPDQTERRVQPISLGIDPLVDTPETMRAATSARKVRHRPLDIRNLSERGV